MRKAFVLVMWFPLTLVLIVQNLMLLSYRPYALERKTPVAVYASPYAGTIEGLTVSSGKILGMSVVAGDGRISMLSEFLSDSPLAPYAEHIVKEADAYDIDYRLIPVIAMCESNLGRRIPSKDSFNAWGIAVYTGKQEGASFADWPMAITWVTRFIRDRFIEKGHIDLKSIGAIWAPPSVDTGHSWANCVETFIKKLE